MLIEIDRLNISVHGISAQIVEEAALDLETELRRRLGSLRGSVPAHTVAELRVAPLDLNHRIDADALRALVAERLLDALRVLTPATEQEETL